MRYPAYRAKSIRLVPAVNFDFPFTSSLRLSTTLDIRLALSVCRPPRGHHNITTPPRVPRPQSTSRRCESERPAWIVLPVSQNRVQLISFFASIPPSSLVTASGEFLRPAASCLLLFRFLPKSLRERQRRLFVPLPKCRPSPWEQTPLAFECPNYKGRKRRFNNVRESSRTDGLFG